MVVLSICFVHHYYCCCYYYCMLACKYYINKKIVICFSSSILILQVLLGSLKVFNPSLAEHDMPCLSKQCRFRSVVF